MNGTGPLARVIWGPWALGAAVLILTIASVATSNGRWLWIVPAAVFVFAHTIVRTRREQSVTERLGRDYDRIQHRVLRMVADLADLAGEKYELWMVDLYLPVNSWKGKRERWWIRRETELSRELSVSLLDTRPQPTTVSLSHTPHGDCYTKSDRLLWCSREIDTGHPPVGVRAVSFSDALESSYGILLLAPLVDQLGKHCRGVMAVHVAPEAEAALQARGALTSTRGLRSVQDACTEINGFLAR